MSCQSQLSLYDFKPLSWLASWIFVALPALVFLTGCDNGSVQKSGLDGIQDQRFVGFYENNFSNPEDEHPKIPGSTLFYMLMTNPTGQESRAYAIDCRGKDENVALVAAAFGIDASNPFYNAESYETLERKYKISEQPILRCSNLYPLEGNKSISKVFRLIDDRPENQKKDNPLPEIFVRFNNVAGDDATNEEQLYSVGCFEILNAFVPFWQNFPSTPPLPILASSAASIFPNFKNYRPLNCAKNTTRPNTFWAALDQISRLPLTKSHDILKGQLEFYRVVDAFKPEKTISYLVGQGRDYTRVVCPNIRDSEVKAALNFPSTYITFDLYSDDSRYFNSLNRPPLECVNIQTMNAFDNRWSTVRELPAVNFYKRTDARTLYRFGCSSAERYFTSGLNLPGSSLQVTSDLMRYLEATPAAGYKLVTFPCYGSDPIEPTDEVLNEIPYDLQAQTWATRQGGFWNAQQWITGDFNGDGKMDLAKAFDDSGLTSIDVHLSSGGGFQMQRWATRQGGFGDAQKWMAGDFNGDGKTDLVNVFDEAGGAAIDVHLSTGSGFGIERWVTGQGGFWDKQQWVVGDFNGDGKADLAKAFGENGEADIDVHLSSGSSFWMERWATRQGGFGDAQKWMAGDFNGDGKTDLAKVFDEGGGAAIDVHLSSGGSFGIERWGTGHGWFWNEQKWMAGDFNGDGKDDLVNVFWDNGLGSIDLHTSSGRKFGMQRWVTRQWGFGDAQKWMVSDFTGEGKADLANVFDDGTQATIGVYRQ